MSRKTIFPLSLVQVQRWRVKRLIEMIERQYSTEEVVTELTSWLSTGIERVPPNFNLADAAVRASLARTPGGEALREHLPCDERGRLSGPSRDMLETAIYAAIAPHLEQLEVEGEPLRSFQPDLLGKTSPQNPVPTSSRKPETVTEDGGAAYGTRNG